MAVGDLITQAEYETATSSASDPRVPLAITAASGTIRSYTGRALGLPAVTETRKYDYDGSGVVEVDDVASITSIVIGAQTLQPSEYVLRPRLAVEENMPYYWIEVAPAVAISPEMGFTWNLDRYPFRTLLNPLTVDVTGAYGWPIANVPGFVKQAAVWTVENWLHDPTGGAGFALSGESISDFSQSWTVPRVPPTILSALPDRAREVLDQIAREAI